MMRYPSVIAATLMSLSAVFLAACEPGAGPFQPSPWAGFPPGFTTAPYSQYRAQYDADRAHYVADPDGFMKTNAGGVACDIAPARQKQFAAAAFMPRPEHATPGWQEVQSTYAENPTAPIIDQVVVRVLAGNCIDGSVYGQATLHASFLRVTKAFSSASYFATKVELLETCIYEDLRPAGECRRYQSHEMQYATIDPNGKLISLHDGPPERSFIADYGAYTDGQEASPGVSFETTTTAAGQDTNKTLARYATGDGRIRYDEYIGGGEPAMTFYRRIPDRALHGPVVAKGGMVFSCYEAGVRVIRAAGCNVE